jgi:hypothetical protein
MGRGMSDVINPGARVRLTVRNRQPTFRPGEKGIVLSGPTTSPGGEDYYVVRMGEDPSVQPLIFMSDEIERDE